MKPHEIVELVKLRDIESERLAVAAISVVAEGHDGIDAVVAAVELDHDEHFGIRPSRGRMRQAGERQRHDGRKRNERRSVQEFTAR